MCQGNVNITEPGVICVIFGLLEVFLLFNSLQHATVWKTRKRYGSRQDSVMTTPGLESLLDFGDGEDVGADLPGDGGEVGVLLLQLHEVVKLS